MMISIPERFRRTFPPPSIGVFVALQVLDILTTLIGLQLGAQESSIFLDRLMHVGPLAALLLAKIMAVALVAMALRMKRPRVIVFLNYWFAAVVTWNLANILIVEVRA
jgi:hypothetical protein